MEVWAVGEGTRGSDYQARPSSPAFSPYASSPLLSLWGGQGRTGMFWLLCHLPAPAQANPGGSRPLHLRLGTLHCRTFLVLTLELQSKAPSPS